MNRARNRNVSGWSVTALGLAAAMLGGPVVRAAAEARDELPFELRQALEAPLKKKLGDLSSQKNSDGVATRRGTYSKLFRKVDDSTYLASFTQDTAGETTLTTERLDITLKKAGNDWKVAEEKVVDTYAGLHRTLGSRYYPFDSFSFEEGGLKISAGKGAVWEGYYEGTVAGFILAGDNLTYTYTAPQYLDYYAIQATLRKDYPKALVFDPQRVWVGCDPETCEKLLTTCFKGLDRKPATGTASVDEGVGTYVPERLRSAVDKQSEEIRKDRRENAFAHFRRPYPAGNRWFNVDVLENDDHSIRLAYNNWGSFDYAFYVFQPNPDFRGLGGPQPLFGYYSEETLKNTDPYELEQRDDPEQRWHELYSLTGRVDAALDDPEVLTGDITYGMTIKQELRELPFFIATIQRGQGDSDVVKRPTLFVNSIQYKGQELTWVRTSSFGGLVVFPEKMAAGTKVELRMNFSTRAIYKVNHAFSATARGGWLPFVTFGDRIDKFELTMRSPAQYTMLGVGTKISEKTEGDVLTTVWRADNPVEFPSFIFGRYQSDSPEILAKKLDGTVIPVHVYADEVSMMQLGTVVNTGQQAQNFTDAYNSGARGIRAKQLRPIGEQAVNAINLYRELSGLDYPYGELNLVNDPAPALYGQAPSSLIYLGSLVFRGEGTMSGDTIFGGGGTNISKFNKSVVAHEVGHQWWGSRVSNANGRNYWFVESLAEYFSALWLEQVYGKKEYQEQVDEWRKRVLDVDQRVSVQNASELWGGEVPGAAYQAAVYNKGPYAFHILRETFGDAKFFPALKRFTQRMCEKGSIVTRDMQAALEEELGGVDEKGNPFKVDLSWFFDQWIRGAGVPQYSFNYDVRPTEDGGYLIEGKIKQRVVLGNRSKYYVMEGKYYRGLIPLTVKGKKQDYTKKIVVEGAETAFRVKVPEKPVDIVLNANGEILAQDVLVNRDF